MIRDFNKKLRGVIKDIAATSALILALAGKVESAELHDFTIVPRGDRNKIEQLDEKERKPIVTILERAHKILNDCRNKIFEGSLKSAELDIDMVISNLQQIEKDYGINLGGLIKQLEDVRDTLFDIYANMVEQELLDLAIRLKRIYNEESRWSLGFNSIAEKIAINVNQRDEFTRPIGYLAHIISDLKESVRLDPDLAKNENFKRALAILEKIEKVLTAKDKGELEKAIMALS